MNILWVCNIPMPECAEKLSLKDTPFGGWMVSLSQSLSRDDGIKLFIAFPLRGIKENKYINGHKVTHIAFPKRKRGYKYDIKMVNYFKKMVDKIKPDIIHIHGMENSHGLAVLNACPDKKFVVSIQGILSVISRSMVSGLPMRALKNRTVFDIIANNGIIETQKRWSKYRKIEFDIMQKAKNVIGRTTFDRAFALQVIRENNYYFSSENLRKDFYKYNWSYEKCEKYSIFISNADSPIKGFHIFLEALPLLVKKFPDVKVNVAGNNRITNNEWRSYLKRTTYNKYISNRISELSLDKHINFLGVLNETQMIEQLLNANVFMMPSVIENSPNALGEAMLLGLPCVAGNVGGVCDILKHNEEGFLYPHLESHMISYYISKIFYDNLLCKRLSVNARKKALYLYNIENNTNNLMEIYKDIIKN